MMKRLYVTATLASLLGTHHAVAQEEDLDRMTYLEEQVRELTGKMEEMQHTLKTLKQADVSIETVDDRTALPPKGHTDTATPKDIPFKKHGADDPKPEESASDDDMSFLDDDDTQVTSEDTPQELYDRALSLLNKKEYRKADSSFTAFLKKHPKHYLAGGAQYCLGESHLLSKEYKQAALHFAKAYKTYKSDKTPEKKKGSKAPEALIKLAFALKGLHKQKEARATLAQLHKEFPKLPKNLQRLAERAQSGL